MLISELGEEGLIETLRALFSDESEDILVGVGDDAAVVDAPSGDKQVWTTDTLVEGIHFQTQWQEPESLGRKCLLVNVSDISAMGARPKYALLSIAAPPESEAGYIISLCRGIKEAAEKLGISVVGGDTTASSGGLVINVSLMGTAIGPIVTRSGASPGDGIIVTGNLGSAAAGLRLLDSGTTGDNDGLVAAFIDPPVRIETAAVAAAAGVSAMTDISDGLAAEIRHICKASGTGARIETGLLPVTDEFRDACARYGWDPVQLALDGGEEYEVLMTLPRKLLQQGIDAINSAEDVKVTVIGEITDAAAGIVLIDADGEPSELAAWGYQHFRE